MVFLLGMLAGVIGLRRVHARPGGLDQGRQPRRTDAAHAHRRRHGLVGADLHRLPGLRGLGHGLARTALRRAAAAVLKTSFKRTQRKTDHDIRSIKKAIPEDLGRHPGRGHGGRCLAGLDADGGCRRLRHRRRDHGSHLLRDVLLALRRHRQPARRQAVEVRGQPDGPAEHGPPVPARHRRRGRALRPRPPAPAADARRRARQGAVEGRELGRGAWVSSPSA